MTENSTMKTNVIRCSVNYTKCEDVVITRVFLNVSTDLIAGAELKGINYKIWEACKERKPKKYVVLTITSVKTR